MPEGSVLLTRCLTPGSIEGGTISWHSRRIVSRRRCVCFIRNHTHLDHFDVARQATLNGGICIAGELVVREWLNARRRAISVFGGRTWKSPLDVPRAGTVQLASPVIMAAPSPWRRG